MKKTLFILCALLLTSIGANAQTDYSYEMTTTDATKWTALQGNAYSPGFQSFGIESYSDGNCTEGKVLYQTITGLSAGTYTVKFYAFARVARDCTLPTADTQSSIAQAYAVAGTGAAVTQALTIPTVYTSSHTGWTDDDIVTLEVELGEGESLEYGIQNATDGGQWYGISAISLISDATPTSMSLNEGDKVETDETNIDHWKITGHHANGTFELNDWSTESDASGMATPFCQYWIGSGAQLDEANINHYQLGGLPIGYYNVSVFARAFDEQNLTEIAAGDIFFTANDHSIDIASGTHGTYTDTNSQKTGAEVYGTYSIYAEVTDAGTLDISFSISSESHCDWIAWKNLNVTYLGTTLDYTLGEPTYTTSNVAPGGEVSITFPNCISPTAGETPTLSSTSKIKVGDTEVDATLAYDGFTATVTFTLPSTITAGSTATVTVPAGLLTWAEQEVSSPATEVTFTLNTIAIAEGDYLIVDAEGNYLGGGLTYGTQAAIIGKPQFIGLEASGSSYHLNSHQHNSAAAHYLGSNLYFDNDTPVDWTITAVEGGYTIYGNGGYLTSSGNQQELASVESSAYTWKLLTMDDVIASMAAATEEVPVDVTALIKAPELKRNSNTVYYPTWTVTGYSDTHSAPANYAFGGNGAVTASCAESWKSSNGFNFNQIITLPLAGTYTLSARGFYGQGENSTDAAPVLYADEQTSSLCVEVASSGNLANEESMPNAYADFLNGLYEVEPITIKATADGQEVSIGFKGASSSYWNVMGELDLQYLGVVEETVEWTMTTANWGTLILPFAATLDSGLTAYSTGTVTLDDDDSGNATLSLTEVGQSIEANTPYLVKGNVEQDTEYTFKGTPVALGEGETLTAGMLTGTFVDMDYDALFALESGGSTVYLLQNHTGENEGGVAFYPVVESKSADATLTPYHCYLTDGSGKGVRGFISFPSSDEATAIEAVEGAEAEGNGAIYDLSGRKVSKAVKGVYIQNGKKVLVK